MEKPQANSPGVNIAGYFDALLGIGEVARRVRDALVRTGLPVSVQPVRADLSPGLPGSRTAPRQARHPLGLLCVNADGIEGAHAALGHEWFAGRYTIGFWWWEAGSFPERWARAFDLVDEIWVGSQHVADMLAPVSPVPVLRMPVPLPDTPPGAPPDRAALGLPAGGPLFLTVFDYGSVLERKNPIGAIRAFREAFPGGEEAALVVKSVGGGRHPDGARAVAEAAGGDERIRLLDSVLPADELAALVAGCDCFVSLHRAEGFGLPLAEAMAAGRPAIATAYGGPRDYLHPGSGYPVDYRLVPIGAGKDPYPADGWWAEPDLAHAVARMREVAKDPEAARERGERARAELSARHSPAAAGRTMAARLAFVAGLPRRDGRAAVLTAELERRIRADPPPPPATRAAALRRPLRDAVLRLIRPHAVHQRQVDEERARVLRTLEERLEGLAASHASLLAELDALRGREQDRR